ncbi:uncharacterized protein LOC128150670 [Harpia harpyja]|uniref:uncharacterized protein LOC128150670 n=1 Tax=Harpia harpyja TaxID=202280 RepID=UPI0022B189F9|nr:uncharacterized protein LOC128150670 [Harpia harpyja]
MGAAITCGEKGCDRSFHLPCASRGECVTQFFGLYRSFCWEHRPEQAVKAKPGQNSTCIICLDPVEDNKSYHTMVCPACRHAWFHRSCIQKQAIHAGVRLCCLRCRNQDQFVMEMLAMGIRISKSFTEELETGWGQRSRDSLDLPDAGASRGSTLFPSFSSRQPSWESDQACGPVYQRHRRCNASKRLCPGGSEQAEEEGATAVLAWALVRGKAPGCPCAAVASVPARPGSRGLGWALAPGRLWAPRWPLLPQGWVAVPLTFLPPLAASRDNSELASPSTTSQAASGLSHSSLGYESSRPSTIKQAPLGPSCSSPVPESSSCSSHPGPDRIRYRSRLQRQAQKPYSQPGNHCRTSRVPAPSAESSAFGTASQLALGPSCRSPALGGSSPSTDRQMALGLFRGSPVPARSSCSSHPGPDRIRYRSRLQRRAQKPYSRPGRRR